ncbi:MAG: hypothetical protein JJE49_09245 [Peptostreptococcaceae bacterium]|nr:hypothetical protein [Peptostreptococcaceae bacterium]
MNWKLDINQLAEDLPKLHSNLFHTLAENDFYERVEKLKLLEKDLNIYSMVVELSKLIALAGDAHTALELPKNNMLPMECYWFEEGIYITITSQEFDEVLHQKLIEIEGVEMSEVIGKIIEIISHENMQFVKSRLPELLVCTDILYGLGIAGSVEKVELKTESLDGNQSRISMPTIKYVDWDKMVHKEDKIDEVSGNETQKLPLFRRNRELYYWEEELEEGRILYVNYKKCKEMENLSAENFIMRLKERLEMDLRIENIVLDYRNNNGGDSELFKTFIEWLSDFQPARCENLKQPFKIFVIVGRDTFSSALLNVYLLKFKTKAIFIGEATGGKPNCYGEVKYFRLKESGLSVRYSTRYYYIIEEYWQDSFYPDINFPVIFRDYLEGRDPCVEWIKKEGINNEQ